MNLNIYKVLLLSATGFLFGSGVLLYDYRATPESIRFVEAPQFTVWQFLLGCLCTFWLLSVFPLWQRARRLWREVEGKKTEPVLSAILFHILITIGIIFWQRYRLEVLLAHHNLKMLIILLGTAVVTVLIVLGIGLVHTDFRQKFDEIKPETQQVESFLRLREQLQNFLSIGGFIIGLSTLATAALRNVLRAANPDGNYPMEGALLLGLYASALLALIYAPAYMRLLTVGRQLRDAFSPFSAASNSWSTWFNERKSLEDLLQLKVNTLSSFQPGVAILSPLIGSVIPVLLE